MKKKLFISYFAFIILIINLLLINVNAVSVNISARTTGGNYISNANLEIYNSYGNQVYSGSMLYGYIDIDITPGETIYYNLRAFDYAANWEAYTIPSNGTGFCYRTLNDKSIYTANGFVKPFSSYSISSKIGYRSWNGLSLHKGFDIPKSAQTSISSICDGYVNEVGFNNSAGNFAHITSAGSNYLMRYMHMYQAASIVARTNISASTTVGLVGTTGDSSGNHLHLDISSGGTYIDPEAFFN